jgi:hypothetical protein
MRVINLVAITAVFLSTVQFTFDQPLLPTAAATIEVPQVESSFGVFA